MSRKTFNGANPNLFTPDTPIINTIVLPYGNEEYNSVKENISNHIEAKCYEFLRDMSVRCMYSNDLRQYSIEKRIKDFNNELKQYNGFFRSKILDVKQNYNNYSIYVTSYQGMTIHKIAGKKYKWKWYQKKSQFKDSTGNPTDIASENYTCKMNCTEDKIRHMFFVELAMIYVKYGCIYKFQAICSFIKLLVDLYDPMSVRWDKMLSIFTELMTGGTWGGVMSAIREYSITGVSIYKSHNRVKDKPTKEQCEKYLNCYGSKKNAMEKIMEHYPDLKLPTVRKLFQKYGLTDQKYTTDKNKSLKK